MTDDIRENLRAVFLAAIMVLSVVAMSASFAGGAVAQVDDGEVSVDDLEIVTNNETLLSEEVRYTNNFDDTKNVGNETGTGVLGIPTQTDAYSAQAPLVSQEQTYRTNVSFTANNTADTQEIEIDFSEANDIGLDVNSTTEVDTGGAGVDSYEINNDAATITITLNTANNQNEDGYVELDIGFVAEDPVEGLSIDGGVDTIDLNAVGSDGSDASDRFVAVESGITGISAADATNITGASSLPSVDAVDSTADANFTQFVGSQISLQTATDGDVIDVYEATTDSDDNYVRGDNVWSTGTAPGNASTLDTSELGAGDYFIVFNEDPENEVYLDLRSLNLDATISDQVTTEDDIEIDVDTDDFGAIRDSGEVEAWILEEGDSDIADVLHVETGELTGQGEETLTVDPAADLDEEGNYYAIVKHNDSGVTTTTDTVEVIEPLDQDVQITSPTPGDEPYNRGDVFEVELEFTNTDTGTVTFGDRAGGQNVEINVTVEDANDDGTASFMVNTFQIGDGVVNGQQDGNADHGVRTTDGGTAIQSVVAHSDLQIGGGSLNTTEVGDREKVMLAGGSYDLVASTGDTSHKESGSFSTDRSVVRLEDGEVGNVTAWNSPTPNADRTIADAETVDTIYDAVANGYVTPQDGNMANNDVLTLNVTVGGLEGFLLNALEEEENDVGYDSDVAEDFYDREDDHLVTDAFDAASDEYADGDSIIGFTTDQSEDQVAEIGDERNLPGIEGATLDVEEEDILAEADDRGTLYNYFLTIEVDDDAITEDPNNPDSVETAGELPVQWNTTFSVDTTVGNDSSSNFPLNDAFGDQSTQYLDWELQADDVEVDGVEDGVLSVPPTDGYEITGTTPIAAGTQIESETQTATGEDPPFFYPNTFDVEYVEDGPNTISFSEDFAEYAGAEFDIDMRRSRQAGSLVGGGIDGQVRELANVSTHTFNDQESGGEVIRIAEVTVNQPGEVVLTNADGDEIGSQSLPEGTSENVRITLDEDGILEESQEVTSTIYDQDGEMFDEDASSAPVQQTAQITVAGEGQPFYQVSDLSPVSATVTTEDQVTVSATVTNIGEAAGEKDVELRLDGETVATEEAVALDAEGSETVEFTVDAPDAGEYQHSIWTEDDDAVGALTVEEPPEPASFEVSLESGPEEVDAGEDISVTVSVENTGDLEATQSITFTFDGEEIGSQEVTLGGGESASQTFDATAPDTAGDYDWEIASDDSSVTATLTVNEVQPADDDDDEPADDTTDDTTDDEDDDGADDGGAGFGIAAALIALLGAALLAYRRQLE